MKIMVFLPASRYELVGIKDKTRFRKVDKVNPKYGGCQARLYVMRSDRKNHESNLEILYLEGSGIMANI